MTEDPELVALSTVCNALASLNTESQQRVLDYASRKFGLATNLSTVPQRPVSEPQTRPPVMRETEKWLSYGKLPSQMIFENRD